MKPHAIGVHRPPYRLQSAVLLSKPYFGQDSDAVVVRANATPAWHARYGGWAQTWLILKRIWGKMGARLTSINKRGIDKAVFPSPHYPLHQSGWADQVKVLASCSQRAATTHDIVSPTGQFAYLVDSDAIEKPYASCLYERFFFQGAPSFEEAHWGLVTEGYRLPNGQIQYATESPKLLTGWRVDDTDKQRFALLVSFEHPSDDPIPKTDRSLEQMDLILRGKFGLSEESIRTCPDATVAAFEEGLAWLKQCLEEQPNAEVLILYSGHGNADGKRLFKREGTAEGYLGFLNEDRDGTVVTTTSVLQPQINEAVAKSSCAYVIVSACHSGAWIA